MDKLSQPYEKEIFLKGMAGLGLPSFFDFDFCYEVYLIANEGIRILYAQNKNVVSKDIDQKMIALYCAGEIAYAIDGDPQNYEKLKNEDTINQIGGVVADKYLSLAMFNHDQGKMTNKYLPPASSLDIYINFMLNIVNSYKKNDPRSTLITDLLNKSLSISRCILNLLVDGYETEAFASWRTLHECECTLILLAKYGDELMNSYLKHMQYGLAFNDSIEDKNKQDEIFYKMKDEMKQYDLKSKDIKKYIEYGWMYTIPEAKEDTTFKLNFRDGLEKLAGLSDYNQRYELSSEVIHSTPLLIYSRKQFFYYLAFLCLYESFFRLEQVFTSLFAQRVSKEQMNQYLGMRKLYYSQLVAIHQRESIKFAKLKSKK